MSITVSLWVIGFVPPPWANFPGTTNLAKWTNLPVGWRLGHRICSAMMVGCTTNFVLDLANLTSRPCKFWRASVRVPGFFFLFSALCFKNIAPPFLSASSIIFFFFICAEAISTVPLAIWLKPCSWERTTFLFLCGSTTTFDRVSLDDLTDCFDPTVSFSNSFDVSCSLSGCSLSESFDHSTSETAHRSTD